MTRDELTKLYAEHGPMVRRIAASAARKYKQDPEEWLARANLIFVEASNSHDPNKGPMEPHLRCTIYARLIGELRHECYEPGAISFTTNLSPVFGCNYDSSDPNNSSRHDQMFGEFEPTVEPQVPLDRAELERTLSQEARDLIGLVFETPRDLLELLGVPRSVGMPVNQFRKYAMRMWGWSKHKYGSILQEIKGALS